MDRPPDLPPHLLGDGTDSTLVGPVEIRLPADPQLSRVLRLAAGGIAGMAGFTVDETEDIKIAVSEVMLALIEHGSGDPIDVEMSVDLEHFRVFGRTAARDFDVEHPDLMLCRTVLEGVSSEHGIDMIGGHAIIWAAVPHSAAR
jgi:hypothetical protein